MIEDARRWISSLPRGDGPPENVLIAGMKYAAIVADGQEDRLTEYEEAFYLALADCLDAYESRGRHGASTEPWAGRSAD